MACMSVGTRLASSTQSTLAMFSAVSSYVWKQDCTMRRVVESRTSTLHADF